jgi:cytochrome c-type biogenesis protein CcmH/NrfG
MGNEFEPTFEGWVRYSIPSADLNFELWDERDTGRGDEVSFYNLLNTGIMGLMAAGPAFTFDTFGAYMMARRFNTIFMIARMTPLLAIPAAAYLGAEVYIDVMTKYAPHEHHKQPSYWRSIAQAIGAGGLGVGTGADSYV